MRDNIRTRMDALWLKHYRDRPKPNLVRMGRKAFEQYKLTLTQNQKFQLYKRGTIYGPVHPESIMYMSAETYPDDDMEPNAIMLDHRDA